MVDGPDHLEEIFGAVFFLTLNFLSISILGLAISLARTYWNRPTEMSRNLAASSYNIYLAHYLFVIGFQLILLTVPGLPGLLKFGIVSGLSILCSYLFSQLFIKPWPRASVALAFGLLIIMVLGIHP